MLDSGALVNLMCDEVFNNLTCPTLEDSPIYSIRGVGSSSTLVRGITTQNIVLGSVTGSRTVCIPQVSFLVIPSGILDTCVLIGLPILSKNNLDINYDNMALYQNDAYIADIGSSIYTSNLTVHQLTEIIPLVGCIFPTVFPGVTLEAVMKDQESDLTVKAIKKFKSKDVERSKLPKRYAKYKRQRETLSISSGILVKTVGENVVPVISFDFLLDIVLNVHVQNAHIGAFKLYELISSHIWNPSLRAVIKEACNSCSLCQKQIYP